MWHQLQGGSLVLCLLLGLAACPGGSGGSAGEVRRQLLRHQQVKRHGRLFFVGMAEDPSLEQATRAAYADITRQLTWLPARKREVLQGLYRVDRTITDHHGTVHLLALLERQAAAEHLDRLAREQRAELMTTLTRCERRLQAGEAAQAKTCIAPVEGQLEQIRELLAAARAAVGDPPREASFPEQTRARALAGRLSDAGTRSRVVLLRIQRIIDGQPSGNLDAAFGAAISEQGFRLADGTLTPEQVEALLSGRTRAVVEGARAAGAGYIVVGRIKARFSSEDSGQFFAWASGDVRLIETTAGKTVAELSHDQIKGGHITRAQACERAIDNAVARLTGALKQKLAGLGM